MEFPASGTGGPPVPPVGPWQPARVVAVHPETARAHTLRLELSTPVAHLAGQHVVIRLTAPDGYRASRSYSIGSAPPLPPGTTAGTVDVTVERLDHGEVSTYLVDGVEVGDEVEVRGPIGGYFVWRGDEPAVLVAGGSGLVPLMAMLRLARATGRSDLVRLVVSVRTPADLLYAGELPGPEATVVHTRVAPPGGRPAGRLTADDLAPALVPGATAFVCGSSGFADAATELLTGLGVPGERIRVERFGPTGELMTPG